MLEQRTVCFYIYNSAEYTSQTTAALDLLFLSSYVNESLKMRSIEDFVDVPKHLEHGKHAFLALEDCTVFFLEKPKPQTQTSSPTCFLVHCKARSFIS